MYLAEVYIDEIHQVKVTIHDPKKLLNNNYNFLLFNLVISIVTFIIASFSIQSKL